MKNILLLAPPAAGKGTQSELLQKRYGLVSISTGDLLREASKRKDSIGEKIRKTIQDGKLVDDETVLELLEERFQKIGNQNFLLDGFPRTVGQANLLEDLLKRIGMSLDGVFYLEVPREVLEKRITGRRLCKSCGKIHNINLEKSLEKCACGGDLIIRSDDTKEAFEVRYQTYLESTAPLIDYYQNKGNLHYVDANRDISEVFSSITLIMESGDLV